MRILVAEGDPVSQAILESLLATWGYETEMTADGITAWNRLQQPDAPRLAIVSSSLTGLNAYDLCRRARKTGSDKERVRIILMGVRQEPGGSRHAAPAADRLLPKPFQPQELHDQIRALQELLGEEPG